MHKLIDYVCTELEELERKADKDGKLSMSEIQYADTLAHMKKNLLKSEEMMGEEYSMDGGSYEGGMYGGDSSRRGSSRSYARGRSSRSYARRGSNRRGANQYGSYDGYSEDFKMDLEELIEEAPNEQIKRKMRELMNEV